MFKINLFIILCSFIFSQHFSLNIEETGESTLFIFEDNISSLSIGDEIGLFDENAIVDSLGNIGELLVGAGTWTGSQTEIIAIHGIDLSQFGGPILPGAVEGNSLRLKIWKTIDEFECTVAYDVNAGTGSFDGLFTAIEEIYLSDPHFILDIENTGESTLFIFQDSITQLNPLDQIGLFDQNGIIDSNGNIGEIQVKGNNVFKQYWKSSKPVIDRGWFATGDLGYLDEEGYLFIVGRSKDLIITGGMNVYPKEVEREIDKIPFIGESAVFGVPHPDYGEAVMAAVVMSKGKKLVPDDIKKPLKKLLAGYKIPKMLIAVDELPRNSMGKVQKSLLQDEYRSYFNL